LDNEGDTDSGSSSQPSGKLRRKNG